MQPQGNPYGHPDGTGRQVHALRCRPLGCFLACPLVMKSSLTRVSSLNPALAWIADGALRRRVSHLEGASRGDAQSPGLHADHAGMQHIRHASFPPSPHAWACGSLPAAACMHVAPQSTPCTTAIPAGMGMHGGIPQMVPAAQTRMVPAQGVKPQMMPAQQSVNMMPAQAPHGGVQMMPAAPAPPTMVPAAQARMVPAQGVKPQMMPAQQPVNMMPAAGTPQPPPQQPQPVRMMPAAQPQQQQPPQQQQQQQPVMVPARGVPPSPMAPQGGPMPSTSAPQRPPGPTAVSPGPGAPAYNPQQQAILHQLLQQPGAQVRLVPQREGSGPGTIMPHIASKRAVTLFLPHASSIPGRPPCPTQPPHAIGSARRLWHAAPHATPGSRGAIPREHASAGYAHDAANGAPTAQAQAPSRRRQKVSGPGGASLLVACTTHTHTHTLSHTLSLSHTHSLSRLAGSCPGAASTGR
jgi:hypothetical protein